MIKCLLTRKKNVSQSLTEMKNKLRLIYLVKLFINFRIKNKPKAWIMKQLSSPLHAHRNPVIISCLQERMRKKLQAILKFNSQLRIVYVCIGTSQLHSQTKYMGAVVFSL